jgi:O-antigen/teichoic acid export membrane protein
MKNNLTFHTAIYSSGNLLIALAGIISFPIITRVFSVEEYGILNLIALPLMFLVGLSKAGLQRSIVRFGSEARAGQVPFRVADVYLTALLGMLASAALILAVWIAVSRFFPLSWVGDPRVYLIFVIGSLVVIGETLYSGLTNIFVSERKSVRLTLVDIVKRYSGLLFVLGGVLLFPDKLYGFYLMTGLHELLFCAVLLILAQRYFAVLHGRPNLGLARQMFAFGIPLVGYELLTHVFSYGDRVLINYFLGPTELGYYSAAYNLCTYVKTIFVASLVTAITPMYMDRWENDGRAETESFLALALRYYLLLAIPATVGLAAISEDLIVFLAGAKYVEAHGVVPYVILGMLVDGATAMVAAGLQIMKRTKLMMLLMATAAIANVLLNLVLIPPLGIEGSALATFLAYVLFTAGCWYAGRSVLTIRVDLIKVALYGIAALAMHLALGFVAIEQAGLSLAVKVILGAVVYGLAVLALDRDLRVLMAKYAGLALASVALRRS